MKKCVLDLVKEIQNSINSNISQNNELTKEENEKYTNFKKWLDDNGAIYPKLLLPIKFSGIIGCQAQDTINQNSCIFYIPYKLLIDSSSIKFDYLPKSLKKNNTLKLVLFLLEENSKKEKSFYKPYIDLILMNDYSNYTPFWKDENIKELNQPFVEENITNYINEINDLYDQIVNNKNGKMFDYNLFKKFYVFVFSRQFNISDNSMFLIPLADLLNHSPYADIKYEFFDSQNLVMKYTSEFNESSNISKNNTNKINPNYTDFSDFFKFKKFENKSQELKIINVDYDDDIKKVELTNDDYFVISTNSQIFEKGAQIFNNYGICSNEYLLVNLGFCLLDNSGDKTRVILSFESPEKKLKNYLVDKYIDDFINKDSYKEDRSIYLRLFIKRDKISKKILNILRYSIYKTEKIKFEKKKEIECLESYISFLDKNIESGKYPVFKLLNEIKKIVYETGIKNDNHFNILLFIFTQKLNLIIQKEVIKSMINILQNDNQNIINTFQDFLNEVIKVELKNGVYLKKEDIKNIIIKYLTQIINIKS